MTETFLILLAGGILLAAAIPDPRQVTLHWLRLCGILSLALGGLALFFCLRREFAPSTTTLFRNVLVGQVVAFLILVLAQLAFVQVDFRRTQRLAAGLAFVVAVLAGCGLLHELMVSRGTAVRVGTKPAAVALQTLACAGVAAMTGLILMEMLLGHAYLTASKMTAAPFARLNRAMIVTLILRIISAVAVVLLVQRARPLDKLWGLYGLFIATRYFVGFAVPAVFLYMTTDCIRRKATQSATGILYVAGVLVFIGEIVALYLVRETGLPF